ncbi:NuA4 domain-containing protein [Rhizoctonia solani AG-1 IA]|uniref:Chromatin modification-related protein EAF6 n=1 Tax=Thanatephorus cucumeris (strain AG1-IA) TaxID=983506 RepID=L8WZY6_THACA|nr:NuA4 domain-containing protein [Rhizoctonia solani AG-1 IA]
MSQPSHEFQQPTKLHAMSTEAEGKALYEGARKDLVNALMKRKDIDKQLAALESQIYTFEGNYLTETTNSGGNIIQGFENYLKHPNAANRKKYEITDGDRIFSNSSSTYGKSMAMPTALPMMRGPAPMSRSPYLLHAREVKLEASTRDATGTLSRKNGRIINEMMREPHLFLGPHARSALGWPRKISQAPHSGGYRRPANMRVSDAIWTKPCQQHKRSAEADEKITNQYSTSREHKIRKVQTQFLPETSRRHWPHQSNRYFEEDNIGQAAQSPRNRLPEDRSQSRAGDATDKTNIQHDAAPQVQHRGTEMQASLDQAKEQIKQITMQHVLGVKGAWMIVGSLVAELSREVGLLIPSMRIPVDGTDGTAPSREHLVNDPTQR